MIKADEFTYATFFTPDELQALTEHEKDIDERLREGHGSFRMALEPGYNKRVWEELARRYRENGWSASIHPQQTSLNGPVRMDFTISHPKAPRHN